MDGMVDETSNVLCAAGVTMFEHILVFPLVEDPTTVRCLSRACFPIFRLPLLSCSVVLGSKKLDDERSDDEEEQAEVPAPKGKLE
jgi:hypothetical protein